MFKRALQTKHWMTIGLEKWNELENLEITPELIRKMRKLKHHRSDSEADEVVSEPEIESEADEVEEGEQESDIDAQSGESDSAVDEAEESESSEVEEHVSSSFSFCPVCPGKKFLSEADRVAHMISVKHLKREAQTNTEPQVVTPTVASKKPKKAAQDKATKEKPTKSAPANNRKSRRAHLASQKPTQ